jgi:hypothetical protein
MSTGAGKGDTPRPKSVDAEEFARRWARAFSTVTETVLEMAPVGCPHCGCNFSRHTGWGRECLRCDTKYSRR